MAFLDDLIFGARACLCSITNDSKKLCHTKIRERGGRTEVKIEAQYEKTYMKEQQIYNHNFSVVVVV